MLRNARLQSTRQGSNKQTKQDLEKEPSGNTPMTGHGWRQDHTKGTCSELIIKYKSDSRIESKGSRRYPCIQVLKIQTRFPSAARCLVLSWTNSLIFNVQEIVIQGFKLVHFVWNMFFLPGMAEAYLFLNIYSDRYCTSTFSLSQDILKAALIKTQSKFQSIPKCSGIQILQNQ